MNVCGIKSKLLSPDFSNLIENYDILVFLESKTDKLDILDIPTDYDYFAKHRTKFKRKSGGIVIAYRKRLSKFIEFPHTESECVQWISISNQLLSIDKTLLLGCIYIPPENSLYSSDECFNAIETEMCNLLTNDCTIALIGDFNSRTKNKDDYVKPDDNLLQLLYVFDDQELQNYMCDFETLENQNVPLQRISLDIANPNDFGHKLLNFCKGNSLFIANSRCAKDRDIGAVTSNNTAVVDYLLLSPTLFSSIKEFEIADFILLFSDIHCGIHVNFHGRVTTDTTTPPITRSRIHWNATEQNRFVELQN